MLQDLAPPVVLTPRQQDALARMLAARRPNSGDGGTPEQSPARTRREILRRLQALYHFGYVQRKKLSDSEAIAYTLGNKGADELVLYSGLDRKDIDWTQRSRETGERYLRHGLMVSRFRHSLTLALRTVPEACINFWDLSGAFKTSVSYEDTVRSRDGLRTQMVQAAVIPDGYFSLTFGSKTSHLFLEADRSTMTNARYLAKLKAYFHFWRTQVRDGTYPSGMKGFRVLTVTLSEERKQNLRRIAAEVDAQGRGLNMFWFACEKSYRARPEDILSAIWQTPQSESFKRIGE